jgi:hypothetical protein
VTSAQAKAQLLTDAVTANLTIDQTALEADVDVRVAAADADTAYTDVKALIDKQSSVLNRQRP